MLKFLKKTVSITLSLFILISTTGCGENNIKKSASDNEWNNKTLQLLNYGKNSDSGYSDFDMKISGQNVSDTWYAFQIMNNLNIEEYDKLSLQRYLISDIKNSSIIDLFRILSIAELADIKIDQKKNIMDWLKSIQRSDGSFENKVYDGELKTEETNLDNLILNSYALKILLLDKNSNVNCIKKAKNNLVKLLNSELNNFFDDNTKISNLYFVLSALKQADYPIKDIKHLNEYVEKCKDTVKKLDAKQKKYIFLLPTLFYCKNIIDLSGFDLNVKDFIPTIMSLQNPEGGFSLGGGEPLTLFATYYATEILKSINQINLLDINKLEKYIQHTQTPMGGFVSGNTYMSDLTSTCAEMFCYSYLNYKCPKDSLYFIKQNLFDKLKSGDIKSWREVYYCQKILVEQKAANSEEISYIKSCVLSAYKSTFISSYQINERSISNIFFSLKTLNDFGIEPPNNMKTKSIMWSKNFLLSINNETPIQLIYFSIFILDLYNEMPSNNKKIINVIMGKKDKNSYVFGDSGITNTLSTLRSIQIIKCLDSQNKDLKSTEMFLNSLKDNDKGGYRLTNQDEKVTLPSIFLGVLLEQEIKDADTIILF